MTLEKRAEFEHSFGEYGWVTLVSDLETEEILYLNPAAEEFFKEKAFTAGTVPALLRMTEQETEWYRAFVKQDSSCGFQPLSGRKTGTDYLLDSVKCKENGKIFRVDCLSEEGQGTLADCAYRTDFATDSNRWSNFDADAPEQNIMRALQAALFTYGADRAFVIEFDTDLKCLADVYSLSRAGFDDRIEDVRPIGDEGLEMLQRLWESGEFYEDMHYDKKESASEKLSEILYGSLESWTSMIVPFQRYSGIRCFLCIDNYRRFYGLPSALRYYAMIISNCMYAARMRENLAAVEHYSVSLGHIPENRLQIETLGGFRAVTKNGQIDHFSAMSTQCGTFFLYLLINRKRMIPVREIADILWPGEIIDNPYNMVKNVAFRTRKCFETIIGKPVILAGNGTYYINTELDIRLDIEEFERYYREAKNSAASKERRMDACRKAFELYKGGLLPNFDSELWLTGKAYYYQLIYMDLVNLYVGLLAEENLYIEMFEVAATAMEKEHLDNRVHLKLVEKLLQNRENDLAMNYYRRIRRFLNKEEDQSCAALFKQKN